MNWIPVIWNIVTWEDNLSNFHKPLISDDITAWLQWNIVQPIFDKTGKTLDTLGNMWTKRFAILAKYKSTKNRNEKQENNVFKFLDKKKIQSPANILKDLELINQQEWILARVLAQSTQSIKNNMLTLQNNMFDVNTLSDINDRNVMDEFNYNIQSLSNLGQKYIYFSQGHKDVLLLEAQFIVNPDDATFDRYMSQQG